MTVTKFTIISALVLLVGCSTAREELGLNRQSPDEFSVLKRAPLTLPPSYALRPPRTGGDVAAVSADNGQTQARRVILGQNQTTASAQPSSSGTQMLLNQAGADRANPEIRNTLDKETSVLSTNNRTVAERLLFWTGDDNAPQVTEADRLDASAEAQRLNDQGITAPTPGEKRVNAPTIDADQ